MTGKTSMIYTQTISRLTLLCILVFAIARYSHESPAPKSPVVKSDVQPPALKSRPEKSISQLGAEMQQAGIMSQKDYIKVHSLQLKTRDTHRISEEDFAWTLSFLKTSGTSMARARAMTALAYIHPMSSAQKARITSAIAPFTNNGDPLDAAYARMVQKSIQRN